MRATITMPLETLKAIIERAREYEFVDGDEDLLDDDDLEDEDDDAEAESDDDADDASMLMTDDDEDEELEADDGEDEEEFEDVLVGLSSEELAELLALAWVGEGSHASWDSALNAAKALSSDDVIVQLAENPTLSDAIESGLVALGYEISDE